MLSVRSLDPALEALQGGKHRPQGNRLIVDRLQSSMSITGLAAKEREHWTTWLPKKVADLKAEGHFQEAQY
jgi:hypothetical protein